MNLFRALCCVGMAVILRQPCPAADPLAGLRSEHPRLLLSDEGLARIKEAAKTDPLRAKLHEKIVQTAAGLLGAPPIQHLAPGGDMLDQARAAVQRIVTCSMAYRLTGDMRFADQAKKDLFTVAAFPDWNPAHFLDVAEFSFATAVGYDWLYRCLLPSERATIRTALREKSLSFAAGAYAPGGPSDKRLWWATETTNWNQVCNCGLLSAALATAEDDPAMAGFVIEGVRRSLPKGMESYAPDGGFPEGPGYWAYGTTYAVIALNELQSALGSELGLGSAPGFDRTAVYRRAVQGPLGLTFNYADSADTVQTTPAYAWLAQRNAEPDELADARSLLKKAVGQKNVTNRFFALHAIWFPIVAVSAPKAEPLDVHFRGAADIAIFRSAWKDPNAVFLGFKAGISTHHHAHLDQGSFVLDAGGKRWALDFGPDNYELPGYFDYTKPRWEYFRVNNFGHNTVTLGGALQSTTEMAPIVAFGSTPSFAFAVADLTPVYRDHAQSLRRGVALIDRARVLIQDEYAPMPEKTPLHWSMASASQIQISADGRTATLTQGDRSLLAQLLSPKSSRFEVGPATPKGQKEDPNSGVSLLSIDVDSGNGFSTTIAVLLSLANGKSEALPPFPIKPLSNWR